MLKFKILFTFALIHFLFFKTMAQEYGLCASEVIMVRKTTDDKSELITELLFGDIYKITEYSADGNWICVENYYDAYKGWIKKTQHFSVSANYYKAYTETTHPVAANNEGFLIFNNQKIILSSGSTLPFYQEGYILLNEEKIQFEGKTKDISKKSDKKDLIETAKTYLNSPYLWGGRQSKGLDCSGFTQIVYKLSGRIILRDSYQQAEQGILVSLSEAKAGDLVFFNRKPAPNTDRVTHVGIVVGDGTVIHADGMVRINRLDETGLYRDDLGAYSHYLKCIRRFE